MLDFVVIGLAVRGDGRGFVVLRGGSHLVRGGAVFPERRARRRRRSSETKKVG